MGSSTTTAGDSPPAKLQQRGRVVAPLIGALALLSVSYFAREVQLVTSSQEILRDDSSVTSLKQQRNVLSQSNTPTSRLATLFMEQLDLTEQENDIMNEEEEDENAMALNTSPEAKQSDDEQVEESPAVKEETDSSPSVDEPVDKSADELLQVETTSTTLADETADKSFSDNDELQNSTIAFVQSRRQAYEEIGMGVNWWMRGVGYLWEMRNMALALRPVVVTSSANNTNNTKIVVQIVNVHANKTLNDINDCAKLSIWVRVRGPEIVAALAQPVVSTLKDSCHWEFHADVRIPGDYQVDAKVLSWNAAGMKPSTMKCNATTVEENSVEQWKTNITRQYPIHAGFKAFKLYDPGPGCCEYCSRIPGCVFWATPAFRMENPSMANNGCELFFDPNNRPRIPQSYLLRDLNTTWTFEEAYRRRRRLRHRRLAGPSIQAGTPHNGQKAWFVGCGWSQLHTLDFPCLSGELDDQVFALDNTFVIKDEENTAASSEEPKLPLCELKDEFDGTSRGRWVKQPWPEDCPPFEFGPRFDKNFQISAWIGDKPHCWHRDDLTQVGNQCLEMNCLNIKPESKYKSPLREEQWMGVWKDRQCDYFEYTDQQLQQCLTVNKISSITRQGMSISEFIYEYIRQRTNHLTFYNETNGVDVVISTLGLLHKTGHTQDQIRRDLTNLPNITEGKSVFVPNTFFLSSERATLAVQENVEKINEIALEILPAKGYKMFNVLEASTAFTYDTATQMDGMHLIGPPMKILITKFFHHLCKDKVEGIVS